MLQPQTEKEKFKVFISYSRSDIAFVDQLVEALDAYGFEPLMDRHDIVGGEEWKLRLNALILEADSVVFVLSPKAAASDICRFEVDIARKIAKRIIPILCAPLAGCAPPEHLSSLNYIYFYQEQTISGAGFGSGLARLIAALRTDICWMREHTRFSSLASRWNERGKDAALLLRGSELQEAEAWLKRQPRGGPEAGEITRAFLAESRHAEDEGCKKKLQDDEMLARATTLERAVKNFISMGLRRKLNVLLLAVGALGALLFAAISTPYLQKLAKEEVEQNARIMSASAAGIRRYTSEEVAPLLVERMGEQFHPQAVSSYAAMKVAAVLHAQFPDYSYREPALNPTNPIDLATDWESDIIQDFRANPSSSEDIRIRPTSKGPVMHLSRPIRAQEPCLVCHDTPQRAPDQMRAIYGVNHGFGWKANEIVGAQIVSAPIQLAYDRAWQTRLFFLGIYFGVLVLLVALLNLGLALIMRTISRIAGEDRLGRSGAPELDAMESDQVARLGQFLPAGDGEERNFVQSS